MWKLIAKILSRRTVTNWLIQRAQRTPYFHLDGYMNRWWLFNRFDQPKYKPWLPSIRIHHILRKDSERVLHDHPWNARTIILRGWYLEEKEGGEYYTRRRGDTATLRYGEFHSIRAVSLGGVVTMFITWKYKGAWGFKVNGKKIPWREYLQETER